MPKIENKLELEGYAWFEPDGSVVWCLKEDLQNVAPHKRPEGWTAVMIEIYPVEEWRDKSRKEREFLGELASQATQLNAELVALQKSLRARE